MNKKFLTKSLFITGLECPRKLYYTLHPETYENKNHDDPFLQALAQGGFQVGALAKVYYPEGIDLNGAKLDEAISKTAELLQKDNVTVFEAAVNHGNLLIRADILQKTGNTILLYEVKSKSFDTKHDSFLDQKKAYIKADWARYIFDVAFQAFVLSEAFPEYIIKSYLTLIDKNAICSVDGLNQRFKLEKDGRGRTNVQTEDGTSIEKIGSKLLVDVDVSEIVSNILLGKLSAKYSSPIDTVSFDTKISIFVDGIVNDKPLTPRLDKSCKGCEFRCEAKIPMKSGFEECWGKNLKFNDHFVFDVWNYRGVDKILESGRYLMEDLIEADFKIIEEEGAGLSTSSRQWLQVQMTREESIEPYVDLNYIEQQIATWKYPLHFIDFETASVAIPFNAGRRPYEPIAFQFSHHTIDADGTISHAGEYINTEPGIFPNFEFVRALKSQLELDEGTIFRYAQHENTILYTICEQLQASNEPDRDELMSWIKTITHRNDLWSGQRNMVDLREVILKAFYHPLMRGSNSLKSVSPALLATSLYLQDKYNRPIYGNIEGINSLNFINQAWVQLDSEGKIKDPYELLPKLLIDVDDKALQRLFEEDEIRHGGAAMTAYAKLQFAEMSGKEREELKAALLKYCELDTFSMVLLIEYLLDHAKR